MRFATTVPPDGAAFEHDRDNQGRVLVWLDHRTVDKLGAHCGKGESYSDVILRLAKAEHG